MRNKVNLIIAISILLILGSITFGQGQRGKVSELPKPQLTEEKEDKFDPCCPPITPKVVADHLKYKGSGGINDPYTLVFDTSMTPFKTQMQNYINYANSVDSNVTKIHIDWRLHDQGNGSVPMTYPNGSLPGNNGLQLDQAWTTWTASGNGNPVITGNLSFFGTSAIPYPMKINNWYMIHTGTYVEKGKFFDDKCATNEVFVRIQVEQKSKTGDPILEIQYSKGKIIDRIPLRPIKR